MAAPNQDSPICAYILDGQAAGAMSDVDTWKPEAGLLWLHLDHTSPKSQEWLRKFSGLDPLVVEALLAEDTRPRSSEIGESAARRRICAATWRRSATSAASPASAPAAPSGSSSSCRPCSPPARSGCSAG